MDAKIIASYAPMSQPKKSRKFTKEVQAKLLGGTLTISQMQLPESHSVDMILSEDSLPEITVKDQNQ